MGEATDYYVELIDLYGDGEQMKEEEFDDITNTIDDNLDDINPNTEIIEILDKLNENILTITVTKNIPVKLAEYNYAKIENQIKVSVRNKTTEEIIDIRNNTSELVNLLNKKDKIEVLTNELDNVSRF